MTATATKIAAEILPAVSPELQAIRTRHEAERASDDWTWEDRDRQARELEALEPKVGMGATWHGYSDSHACTIIEVRRNGREIVVREDKATLLNGVNSGQPDALTFSPGGFAGHTSGHQRWAYTANPDGHVKRYSRRELKVRGEKRIVWVRVGDKARGGERCTIGRRSHHYDFNF